jgi:hypothetical protein
MAAPTICVLKVTRDPLVTCVSAKTSQLGGISTILDRKTHLLPVHVLNLCRVITDAVVESVVLLEFWA